MKLTIATTAEVKFQCAYFENSEGGMDDGTYGNPVDTIEEAVELLRLAKIANPNRDWVIEGRVEMSVSNKKKESV